MNISPTSATGFLHYDLNIMAKEAILSAKKQFDKENHVEEFYNHFLGDEETLCRYCIDAFFNDPNNAGGYNIMRQAMAQVSADLSSAIIAYYRS